MPKSGVLSGEDKVYNNSRNAEHCDLLRSAQKIEK